jgi:hypothetical protein
MQGHYILHEALRALGAKERITSVTSFRPKDPALPDDSTLKTVRGISDTSELYYQYADYRLENIEERIRNERKRIRKLHQARKKFDVRTHKTFLMEQVALLQATDKELVEYADIKMGVVDTHDFPDAVVGDDVPKSTWAS